ncbi:MAG: type II secretion system ATPase GspE [Candidatus Babeliales bacterium]
MIKSIADILVSMGVLSHDQVIEEAGKAQESEQSFEDYLVDNKLISQEQLAKAYSEQLGIPYIDQITEKMTDPTILVKVPLAFLRQNIVIPITIDEKPFIITANPSEYQPIDELRMLLGNEASIAISIPKIIIDAINRYYPIEGTTEMIEGLAEERELTEEGLALEGIEEKDILTMAQEAPIIKLVNHIMYQAVKRNASDIHVEPYEKEVQVRYRIDGVMYLALTPPKRIQGAIVSRIKIMANLNIAEKRLPQDGRINIKVGDKPIDIRVSILPTSFGERIVMRLLDKSKTFGRLAELGFDPRDFKLVLSAIGRPNGIVLLTGPTGSGKTSTLYSLLSKLNQPEVNIITVEDPVEYQMQGVSQVQVQPKIGLTFAAALRSILRQDPDIIMIGETRDLETAQIAIQAALTGHLVLSTLHTNSAPATITRLVDMGIEPFLIASTVTCVIAQRLVRQLCVSCKEKYTPTPEMLASVGITQQEAQGITFYKPKGCEECGQTGFKGRLAIFEVMPMTQEIAKLTMEQVDASIIRKAAIKEGMTLLVQDGVRKIKEGLTTIEEILSVATTDIGEEV